MKQSTIKSEFHLEGIGVHSGLPCKISAYPANENHGIVYVLNGTEIFARYDNVTETTMSTRISNGNVFVMTIEHLSSALFSYGITNLTVELSGNEIPILDGSAKKFAEAIEKVGVEKQNADFRTIKILKPVEFSENNKYVKLLPSDKFSMHVACDFSIKGLKTKDETLNFDELKTVLSARTFGFLEEVEYIRQNGLAKGASLDNTVVFDKTGKPINEEGLRFPNEPVYHKTLDAIGDLSLANGLIQGKYDAFCPGHRLNNQLLRKLFSDKSNYEII